MRRTVFTLIFSTLISFASVSSLASTAFEVEGSLETVKVDGPDQFGLKIVSPEGELKISELQAKFRFCDEGVYLVVNNLFPENTYTLLDIIECFVDDE